MVFASCARAGVCVCARVLAYVRAYVLARAGVCARMTHDAGSAYRQYADIFVAMHWGTVSCGVMRCHTQPLEIVSMLMNLYKCIQSDPI